MNKSRTQYALKWQTLPSLAISPPASYVNTYNITHTHTHTHIYIYTNTINSLSLSLFSMLPQSERQRDDGGRRFRRGNIYVYSDKASYICIDIYANSKFGGCEVNVSQSRFRRQTHAIIAIRS
jgi:hypothetical protein